MRTIEQLKTLAKKTHDFLRRNILNSHQNKFIVFVPYCEVFTDYIIECLESIKWQKYYNYEVLIINDGASHIKHIQDYISDKPNFRLINHQGNHGPAFSKAAFIDYVKKNAKDYSREDIAIIIDGDDYLLKKRAFSIINSHYARHNCWSTCGHYKGQWSKTIKKGTQGYIDNVSRRQLNYFFFPPPRTFKLGLLRHIDQSILKINNRYIKKSTDRALFSDIIELCGITKVKFISRNLYFYRSHHHNSHLHTPTTEHQSIIESIGKRASRQSLEKI